MNFETLTGIAVIFTTFCIMEFVAWFAHKYIMHGFLWSLHRDHHHKADHEMGFLERNDAFFIIFALPAMVLFITGGIYQLPVLSQIAWGISLYGMAYALVHEIFIHQRIKWLRRTDNFFFQAIRKAHKIHHKHLSKEDGECFGLFVVPWRFYKEYYQKSRRKKVVKMTKSASH